MKTRIPEARERAHVAAARGSPHGERSAAPANVLAAATGSAPGLPLRPAQVLALQRTAGNQAVAQLLAGPAAAAKPTVMQRYDVQNLKQVNPDKLTPDQIKLYNALSVYQLEREYLRSLIKRAQDAEKRNPNEAREMRVRRRGAEKTIGVLAVRVRRIPENIFRTTSKRRNRKKFDSVNKTARDGARKVLRALKRIQDALRMAFAPTRTFDHFMGDAKRLGEYATGNSRSDPIPIVWYKHVDHYHDIVLSQPDRSGETQFTYPDGPELEYNNTVIDLTDAPADPFAVGTIFRNTKNTNERARETMIMAALRAYGFNAMGKDGDHIIDLGFEGTDTDDNVWPLAASINRRPYLGWRTQYGLNYLTQDNEGATGTLASMPGKYFRIKEHMSASGGAIPAEGKGPDPESGLP